jgi:hypothetical protein
MERPHSGPEENFWDLGVPYMKKSPCKENQQRIDVVNTSEYNIEGGCSDEKY